MQVLSNGWLVPDEDEKMFNHVKGDKTKNSPNYEKRQRLVIEQEHPNKKTFLDVGANIGVWSLAMEKQFDNVILSLLKDRFDFYKKLDENSGLKNLEISWSNNTNWLNLVSNIKIKYPDINLGSASIVNKQSIEDSIKIGLKFSMMKEKK